MGYFKIKASRKAFGKIAMKVIKKFFGKDIDFTEITISVKTDNCPDSDTLKKMTEAFEKADINVNDIKAQWIKV